MARSSRNLELVPFARDYNRYDNENKMLDTSSILPDDTLKNIFEYLSFKDQAKIRTASKSFNKLIQETNCHSRGLRYFSIALPLRGQTHTEVRRLLANHVQTNRDRIVDSAGTEAKVEASAEQMMVGSRSYCTDRCGNVLFSRRHLLVLGLSLVALISSLGTSFSTNDESAQHTSSIIAGISILLAFLILMRIDTVPVGLFAQVRERCRTRNELSQLEEGLLRTDNQPANQERPPI